MFDNVTPNTNNVNFLVAVDQQQPLRVGGFIDRVDDETIVFVGLDLNDNPARATQQLLTQSSGAIVYTCWATVSIVTTFCRLKNGT